MNFEEGHLYHIYNQGNNRQKIFFNKENYLFFLKKMKIHLLPYCNIIAYCLMPNHFHFMVRVNKVEIEVENQEVIQNRTEQNRGVALVRKNQGMTQSQPLINQTNKKQTLNQSIGILLRSYTRAINKQQGFTGALFREGTKSECLTASNGLTPSFFNTLQGIQINKEIAEREYPQVCFNYIHNNPVKEGIVKRTIDWEFSSAKDYAGLRNGSLVNKEIAKQYLMQTI